MASQPGTFNVQEFTDAGLPLSGGRLYTYAYGTTTQLTAYTDAAGAVPHTYTSDGAGGQYIALNSRGELPAPLYLSSASYDLALKRSDGSTVWTRRADGISSSASLIATTGAGLVGFSHANTYVAGTVGAKLKNIVNVKDAPYNCLVDGATDDTAGYQAALNAALTVYVPAGTMLHGNISMPAGRTVIGVGRTATVIKMKSTANVDGYTMASVNDIEFQNCTLDGNKANNLVTGNGFLASGTTARLRFFNVRITNWRSAAGAATAGTSEIEFVLGKIDNNGFDGFQMTTVDRPSVMFSSIESNGRYGSVFGSGCTNVRDIGNYYKSNAQGGSVMVGGNDAVRLGNIADTNGTGHGFQYNATIRGTYTGNISKSNGLSGFDFTLGSSYGAAVGNISYSNAVRGIEIDSGTYYNSSIGNIVYRNGEVGISVYRSPTARLIGNLASENGTTTAPRYGIRMWDDLNTLPSNNCALIGNNASDDRGGSATQTYGVSIEAASTTGTVLVANKMDTNVTGAVSAVAGSVSRARDNLGWITQNEGGSAIASGTTSVVINHGLSVTPAAENFTFTLTSLPTNATDMFSVSSITSTQFTASVRANPGAGGLNFRWRVNAY